MFIFIKIIYLLRVETSCLVPFQPFWIQAEKKNILDIFGFDD